MRRSHIFRGYRIFLLAGVFVCFLSGCVANIVAYYRGFGDPSTSIPIFEPSLGNPKHAPLTTSTMQDLVEFSDQRIGAVTATGSLIFDAQWNVSESALFSETYVDVAILQTHKTSWIYAEAHPVKSETEDWYTRDYHVYKFGATTPTHSFRCNRCPAYPFRGRPVVNLSGDGTFSVVFPCERANRTNFLAFLNLTNGTVRTVEIPFNPIIFVVGDSSSGMQSVIVLADYPRINIHDIDDASPEGRRLDLQRYKQVVYTIEETFTGELTGKLSDEIPKFDTLTYHEIPALVNRVVLDHDSEFLFNDELYPGYALVQWRFDGTLKNWWYFDLRANLRSTSHWVNDKGKFSVAGTPASIAVLSGWGHWCQWYPCQDAILLLGADGRYKLIDITTTDIDALLLTSRNTLLATREGEIHEYDLASVQENIAWQNSVVPEKHLEWISQRSGESLERLRKIYLTPIKKDSAR
ncbi:MAG: hypothetical protein F4Z01_07660 [Gammaproteobacteria bacterium]|nr:hypothetical protein [Gammaproteobacteria bacterium]MYF37934.1 hypothetical protein [Gammaproteobacteria bacterium]